MAKVTYIPEDQEDKRPVQWMGVEFIPREATAVDNPALIELAKANPFFEVGENTQSEEPETIDVRVALEAEAAGLNIDVDKRWSDKTLREKIEMARANPFFEVGETAQSEEPETIDVRVVLEAEAAGLNIEVDKRWSDKTLREKIEMARANDQRQ